MEISKGDLIQSLNGRDKGKPLFVAEVDGEYLVLVDGKSRRLEHPKRKKAKHCMFLTRDDSRVAEKMRAGERVANSDLRRAIAAYKAETANSQSESDDETGGG